MKPIIAKISAVLLLTGAALVACDSQEVKKPPDKVTVQLKWIHQAQFAGFYIAEKKGFYAEENIDVTLNAGGTHLPTDAVIDGVIDGDESTFAVVGGDKLLTARFNGKTVVAIAVIFQKNPFVYASLKGSGIKRPQDLKGKKLMVSKQAEIQHHALLRKLGISKNTIEIIPYKRDIEPLVTGQIEAHMMYRTGLALTFEEKGHELDFIWVDNFGIRFYADTIIVTEQLVRQNPALAERFLRATMKGWRYAIENQAEATDITLQYDATLKRDRQIRMLQTQTPLIHTGETQIGWMDRRVWEGMYDILLEKNIIAEQKIKRNAKAVSASAHVDEYVLSLSDKEKEITEAFTMQFLNKIYDKAK